MPECILFIMNIILHLIAVLYSIMLILRRAWYKVKLLQHSTHWNNKFLMYQGFHMRYCTNLILKASYNHKMVIDCNILFKNLFPQIWNELGPLKVLKSKFPKLFWVSQLNVCIILHVLNIGIFKKDCTVMTTSKYLSIPYYTVQCCSIKNQQSPVYVINWYFSRCPDRC